MSKAKRPRPHIPQLSPEETQKLIKLVEDASYEFRGNFDELEAALGMLMVGRLIGWRVLVLIHNKRTIRKYEEILGIKIREFFPETGPLTYKSLGYKLTQNLGNFWKAVSGEFKVENRRELTKS